MDNSIIKIEDDNDENILLDIEKQEVENKNIAVNFNFTVSEEAIVEKSVVKKEESNDDTANRSFETVFLPEVYEGVAVETPFFDFNRYKRLCGLPTEDYEIKSNAADYINVYNSENIKLLQTENNQVNSENVVFLSPIAILLPHCQSTNQTSNIRPIPECNTRIPMNNLVNYNIYQPGYYMTTHLEKDLHHRDREDCSNDSICSNPPENKKETEQDDVIVIEDTDDVDRSENSNTQCGNKVGDMNYENMRTFSNDGIPIYKGAAKSDEAKYKCPICKRPRLFYTLTAVNNHLKFEHISLFRNNGSKPRESVSPENSTEINAPVDRLHPT